jgi:hypothetical protein
MTNYTLDDLLDFLGHASDKGLMPAASAQALAVASRNVFGVLEEDEQKNLEALDLDAIIRRFNNKRARDFSPTSLKEYGRRVRKAMDLYAQWKHNPADFSVKTRAPRKARKSADAEAIEADTNALTMPKYANRAGAYQSSFPVGPGRVITLLNVPEDLTAAEAERLAQFVRMLSID